MELLKIRCKKCGWAWPPRVESPLKCPHCQTREYAEKEAGEQSAKIAPAASPNGEAL